MKEREVIAKHIASSEDEEAVDRSVGNGWLDDLEG